MTNEEKIKKALIDYFATAMPNLATGEGLAFFSVQKDKNDNDVVVATVHPEHFDVEIVVRRRYR